MTGRKREVRKEEKATEQQTESLIWTRKTDRVAEKRNRQGVVGAEDRGMWGKAVTVCC